MLLRISAAISNWEAYVGTYKQPERKLIIYFNFEVKGDTNIINGYR